MAEISKENRDLLFRELCFRLPYNTVVENTDPLDPGVRFNSYLTGEMLDEFRSGRGMFDIRPILRPISDMTEEEVDTLFKILRIKEEHGEEWIKVNDIGIIRLFTAEGKDFYELAEALEYLGSIHIDYRFLIDKGLAVQTTADQNIY